jgi:predicted nucleic acid-binding protein
MARVLIDSDVFVDHLRGRRRLPTGVDDVHYSSVTRAELFAGRGTVERRVRSLLEPFTELPVDGLVAERAGRLRRQVGLPVLDALIAATALEHHLVLVTGHVGAFAQVRGLRARGPDE